MSKQLDTWLVQAFRCSTIKKDWPLEKEVLFINMEKQKLYKANHA
jgi:hypothetical protein